MSEAVSSPDFRPGTVPPLAMHISVLFDALVGALHSALPAAGFPDIRPAHSINLFRVIDADGTRPGELARRAGISPQAMAEIVRYLEGRGYAERIPDPADGRARIVRLTPHGRQASAVAARVFTDLETQWERHLGQAPMARLRHMLAELATLQTASQGPESWPEHQGHEPARDTAAGKQGPATRSPDAH